MAFTGLGGGGVSLPGMGKQVLVAANTLPSSLFSNTSLPSQVKADAGCDTWLGNGSTGGSGFEPRPLGFIDYSVPVPVSGQV